MEPVHGGRDDLTLLGIGIQVALPQWSPSTEDGTTCGTTARGSATSGRNGARPRRTGRPFGCDVAESWNDQPQWSPSTEDGTTRATASRPRRNCGRNGARPRRTGRPRRSPLSPGRRQAAMEPVHGGRDDGRSGTTTTRPTRPQWSPSTEDGTTAHSRGISYARSSPQWSPSTEDGTTTETVCRPRWRARRNGARPRRTGRLWIVTTSPSQPISPQWSPSTEDGTTRDSRRPLGSASLPQWSPSTEDGTTTRTPRRPRWPRTRRNGARPRRTGRPACCQGGECPQHRRNGARPRRTGRPLAEPAPRFADLAAAMEPVHGGRDDCPAGHVGGWATPAAMEPVHGGRDDVGADAGPVQEPVEAAMEPVHGGRDDRVPGVPHALGRGAAMEPVHGGRDDPVVCVLSYQPLHVPQWSPSTEDGTTRRVPATVGGPSRCRNGARPRRTGRRGMPPYRYAPGGRRNGARPRRTGRPRPAGTCR